MNGYEYIASATRTCKRFPDGLHLDPFQADLMHATLGMGGEIGEFIDAFKKHLIYGKPLDVVNLREEAGDILWYMAIMINALGSSFELIMQENIDKLKKRYPEKYTDEHAAARLDKVGE